MTSPVKCTVGARGSGKNELDLLPELLGTRFFSVRTTDVTLLDPSGGEARPAGTLSHSEAVHVVGSTFRVRQVVVGDLDLGAHVASIGTIREEGWRWREGGVFTTGYFPAGLEGGRQADVRFTQIYERTETVRKPRRGHGKRRRHKPLPHHWWLQVDVTRFAPGPHKVEYETVSRLSFRPPR
jgi:hypothetical protein